MDTIRSAVLKLNKAHREFAHLAHEDWFTPTLDVLQVLHDNGWRGNSPRAEAMLIAPSMKRLNLEKNTRRWLGSLQRGYSGLNKKYEPQQ